MSQNSNRHSRAGSMWMALFMFAVIASAIGKSCTVDKEFKAEFPRDCPEWSVAEGKCDLGSTIADINDDAEELKIEPYDDATLGVIGEVIIRSDQISVYDRDGEVLDHNSMILTTGTYYLRKNKQNSAGVFTVTNASEGETRIILVFAGKIGK